MILATLPSLDHAASGPTYSVPALCKALQDRGEDVTLFTATGEAKGNLTSIAHCNFPLSRLTPKLVQASPYMNTAIKALCSQMDVLYCNGMWALTASSPARIAHRKQIPTLLAPRGSLSPSALSQSAFKKRFAWPLIHKRAFENACCFHATSRKEYEEIRAFGLTAPVAIIPNGISISNSPVLNWKRSKRRTALFLGRLHPIKGIDLLIEAWSGVDKSTSKDWQLKIIGPDVCGIKTNLQKQVAEVNITNIYFEEEITSVKKCVSLRESDLFILPSHTENFGMVVAEALACATPVITTNATPWSGLMEKKCGWWVENNVNALKSALEAAIALPDENLDSMGERGRRWMVKEFSWEKIAQDFVEVLAWLKTRKQIPPPKCVMLN